MRQISKRESTLLRAFGLLILLAVLAVGATAMLRWHRSLQAEKRQLEEQITTARFWLEQEARWRARDAWLKENYRPLQNRNDAVSSFLEKIQSTARAGNLELSQQEILEPENEYGSNHIQIRVGTTTAIKNLIEWINRVQSPEALIAVPEFQIKPVPESDDVQATLIFEKYFPPTGSTSPGDL